MNELRSIRAMISEEFKGKIRFINLNDESQYVDVPLEKGVDSKWGDILLESLVKKKQKYPIELFEESLDITDQQRIRLYEYWGSTKVILIKNTATVLEISKREATSIIDLAFKYHLLTQGHNSTWKVIDNTVQERWIIQSNMLKKGEKPLNYNMPQTPQESLDKLAKMSTSEQKAKARGEACVVEESMTVKEESPVEVIDDNKIYSGAAQAKTEERKRWDREVKEGGEKAKAEMNKKSSSLPACVVDMTKQYEKKMPESNPKGQNLPKKKPLVQHPLRKK